MSSAGPPRVFLNLGANKALWITIAANSPRSRMAFGRSIDS